MSNFIDLTSPVGLSLDLSAAFDSYLQLSGGGGADEDLEPSDSPDVLFPDPADILPLTPDVPNVAVIVSPITPAPAVVEQAPADDTILVIAHLDVLKFSDAQLDEAIDQVRLRGVSRLYLQGGPNVANGAHNMLEMRVSIVGILTEGRKRHTVGSFKHELQPVKVSDLLCTINNKTIYRATRIRAHGGDA